MGRARLSRLVVAFLAIVLLARWTSAQGSVSGGAAGSTQGGGGGGQATSPAPQPTSAAPEPTTAAAPPPPAAQTTTTTTAAAAPPPAQQQTTTTTTAAAAPQQTTAAGQNNPTTTTGKDTPTTTDNANPDATGTPTPAGYALPCVASNPTPCVAPFSCSAVSRSCQCPSGTVICNKDTQCCSIYSTAVSGSIIVVTQTITVAAPTQNSNTTGTKDNSTTNGGGGAGVGAIVAGVVVAIVAVVAASLGFVWYRKNKRKQRERMVMEQFASRRHSPPRKHHHSREPFDGPQEPVALHHMNGNMPGSQAMYNADSYALSSAPQQPAVHWLYTRLAGPGGSPDPSVPYQGPLLQCAVRFDPAAPDECGVAPGQWVELRDVFRDGWGMGWNRETGGFGMMPLSCLRLSELDAAAATPSYSQPGPATMSRFVSQSHATQSTVLLERQRMSRKVPASQGPGQSGFFGSENGSQPLTESTMYTIPPSAASFDVKGPSEKLG